MTQWMPSHAARVLLERAGVPFALWRPVTSREDAESAARSLGGLLALKTAAVDVVHKSDIGCVVLGVQGADAAGLAYEQIVARALQAGSTDAQQVMVESMVGDAVAEVLIGVVRDPSFGPVLVMGLGGIWVEVLRDVARRLCPVTQDEALGMLRSLQGISMLTGARGRAPADLAALASIASDVSALAMADARIDQIDLNPVMALRQGACAVDARILLRDLERSKDGTPHDDD